MIEKIKTTIDKFLSGNYDPVDFSFDLPDMIVDNYKFIERENPKIAKELDDTFPEICAEFERGFDPAPFREKIKSAYKRIFDKY